jgi:hypothetical protein
MVCSESCSDIYGLAEAPVVSFWLFHPRVLLVAAPGHTHIHHGCNQCKTVCLNMGT